MYLLKTTQEYHGFSTSVRIRIHHSNIIFFSTWPWGILDIFKNKKLAVIKQENWLLFKLINMI